MIFKNRSTHIFLNKQEQKIAREKKNIAIIPMAVPVILGPGVLTVLLVLGDKAHYIIQKEELFISLFFSMLAIYFTLSYAEKILKFLGIHGIKILSFITGIIIIFISFIFLIDGIRNILSFM
jgi:multiple antibiotic resistance protein